MPEPAGPEAITAMERAEPMRDWKLKALMAVGLVALAARWLASGGMPEVPGIDAFLEVADHVVIWALLAAVLYLPLRALVGAVQRHAGRRDD